MYDFTTEDGFMNVDQSLEDMIKYLANEPSEGLFFVQQHARNAMPNLINLKGKVVERTRETALHTEDLEDSILAVRSMSECGFSIADEMIKDINRSLHIMLTTLPRRGLIQNPTWGEIHNAGSKTSSLLRYSSGSIPQGELNSQSYLSSVFNSAKQKATSLRWSPLDSTTYYEFENSAAPMPSIVGSSSSLPDTAAEEPLSLQTVDHDNAGQENVTERRASTTEDYELFTSEREAKLEKWLEEL